MFGARQQKSKLEKGVRVRQSVGAQRRGNALALGKGARGSRKEEACVKTEFVIPGQKQKGGQVRAFYLPVP